MKLARNLRHNSVMKDMPENSSAEHQPVMLKEALELLQCSPGGTYVDLTAGLGGHARAIAERIQPGGTLIGIDRDDESLQKARGRLKPDLDGIRLFHDNFKNLPLILNNLGLPPVDGILADLGVSSFQLLSEARGFSFRTDAMLDMRMDQSQRTTAASLVNELSERQLADIIYINGEEPLARRIAAAIVQARQEAPITRCSQLANVILRAVKVREHKRIHPATRTFQALRIAVNQELEGLDELLTEALSFLRPGGRMVIISFHSLEDRVVKTAFRRLAGQCVCERRSDLCICPRLKLAEIVTQRPLSPGPEETAANPRSRSARMRCLKRI
jgi:16S rRNA (cytosine1402-N4)-methyltransferase